MSLVIESYYGYDTSKIGYVKGNQSRMAVCHSHVNPYHRLILTKTTSETAQDAIKALFQSDMKKVGEVSTDELVLWKESLECCIGEIDKDLQAKLEREDENYRKVANMGCTEDGVVLREIQEELKKRESAKSSNEGCTNCYQLARRIQQLEQDNLGLASKIDALSKKKRCCSLFF